MFSALPQFSLWSRPNQVWERFEPLRVLATGNTSVVVKATRRHTGELTAVKLLNPARYREEAIRRGHEVETRLLARLAADPNVVRLSEHGAIAFPGASTDSGGSAYLALELANATTSDEWLDGRASWPRRLSWLSQVVWLVHRMQQDRVCHRDLKLENLLVMPGDRIALSDFGRGTVLHRRAENPTDVAGDPRFWPPEYTWHQLDSSPDAACAAESWLFGSLMFEMATGLAFSATLDRSTHLTRLRLAMMDHAERSALYGRHRSLIAGDASRSLELAHPTLPSRIAPDYMAIMVRFLSPDPDGRPDLRDRTMAAGTAAMLANIKRRAASANPRDLAFTTSAPLALRLPASAPGYCLSALEQAERRPTSLVALCRAIQAGRTGNVALMGTVHSAVPPGAPRIYRAVISGDRLDSSDRL